MERRSRHFRPIFVYILMARVFFDRYFAICQNMEPYDRNTPYNALPTLPQQKYLSDLESWFNTELMNILSD